MQPATNRRQRRVLARIHELARMIGVAAGDLENHIAGREVVTTRMMPAVGSVPDIRGEVEHLRRLYGRAYPGATDDR